MLSTFLQSKLLQASVLLVILIGNWMVFEDCQGLKEREERLERQKMLNKELLKVPKQNNKEWGWGNG